MHPFSLIFVEHDSIDVCTIHFVTSKLAIKHRCWCSGYSIRWEFQSMVVQPTLGKKQCNAAYCLNIDKVQLRCNLNAFAHAG
jgi:hypothetical protein